MFGERLQLLRKEKKMTQKDLAELLRVSPSTIGMYEQGRRDPDTDIVKFLADYFEVSIDYLLGRSDSKKRYGLGVRLPDLDKHFPLESTDTLTKKDEKDIEKLLDKTIELIDNQEGLMLNGEVLDDEDLLLLKQAIRNGLEYAKISNKKKYTRKDYRKDTKDIEK